MTPEKVCINTKSSAKDFYEVLPGSDIKLQVQTHKLVIVLCALLAHGQAD